MAPPKKKAKLHNGGAHPLAAVSDSESSGDEEQLDLDVEHGDGDDSGSEDSESDEGYQEKSKRHRTKPIVTASAGETYLTGASATSKTSDALLSTHLARPFSLKSYAAALRTYDELPGARLPAPPSRSTFSRWAWELQQGFSLLVHGFGSKRRVLNDFATYLRKSKGPVIVVDGYEPEVSFPSVLGALEALVPSAAAALAATNSQLDKRVRNLLTCLDQEAPTHPLHIVVHSLDRGALAPTRALSLLAALAAHPQIRFTASVDHVRALLLFPTSMVFDLPPSPSAKACNPSVSRIFSFVFHELSTLQPYTAEVSATALLSRLLPPTLFPPPSLISSSKHSSLASAQFVLATVTPSSRLLFLLLAQLQLAASPSESSLASPVPLATLQDQAIEQMIALGAPQVAGLLSEFRDHGVVRDGDADGGKTVGIALRCNELEELLEREGIERDV